MSTGKLSASTNRFAMPTIFLSMPTNFVAGSLSTMCGIATKSVDVAPNECEVDRSIGEIDTISVGIGYQLTDRANPIGESTVRPADFVSPIAESASEQAGYAFCRIDGGFPIGLFSYRQAGVATARVAFLV